MDPPAWGIVYKESRWLAKCWLPSVTPASESDPFGTITEGLLCLQSKLVRLEAFKSDQEKYWTLGFKGKRIPGGVWYPDEAPAMSPTVVSCCFFVTGGSGMFGITISETLFETHPYIRAAIAGSRIRDKSDLYFRTGACAVRPQSTDLAREYFLASPIHLGWIYPEPPLSDLLEKSHGEEDRFYLI
jgi:hypothetical protein